MGERRFQGGIWLTSPIEKVFLFFSDPYNLERLTPPWLRFEVLTPRPIKMGPGTVIDYRLRLHGLPLRWQSEITVWEPPVCFVDEQRRGPYKSWVHEHRFGAQEGGTMVTDVVRYSVGGGSLVQKLLVAPDLRRIFSYRHDRLREIFDSAKDCRGARENFFELFSRVTGKV